jgi:hypothetical protein
MEGRSSPRETLQASAHIQQMWHSKLCKHPFALHFPQLLHCGGTTFCLHFTPRHSFLPRLVQSNLRYWMACPKQLNADWFTCAQELLSIPAQALLSFHSHKHTLPIRMTSPTLFPPAPQTSPHLIAPTHLLRPSWLGFLWCAGLMMSDRPLMPALAN